MRSIFLTSGEAVAMVGCAADAGIGAGVMLGSDGKTVGFDLFCEIESGRWIHALELPPGVLTQECRRHSLSSGIVYDGRFISRLNVKNISDKLIASKLGIAAQADKYTQGTTAFKAEIQDPLDQILSSLGRIGELIKEHSKPRTKQEKVQALITRVRTLVQNSHDLDEEDKQETEEKMKSLSDQADDVEPHPMDIISDFARAMKGKKTLTTEGLEILARAQRIGEFVGENDRLLGDPRVMAQLRQLLHGQQ